MCIGARAECGEPRGKKKKKGGKKKEEYREIEKERKRERKKKKGKKRSWTRPPLMRTRAIFHRFSNPTKVAT